MSDHAAHLVALVASALALACWFWALSERARACAFRRSAHEHRSRGAAAAGLRDAVIAAGREAILVWGPDLSSPLVFGCAASLLEACTRGPDAAALSAAREALVADGTEFALALRTADERTIAVRGLPIGGHAVMFLEEQAPRSQEAGSAEHGELDHRTVLDALPFPVWIRAKDTTLDWVNRAFLDVTGAATREVATEAGIALDRSERDLAAAACDAGEPLTAKRYVMVGAARRAFSFSLNPLPGGGVAGTALELSAFTDPAREQQLDAYTAVLNRLTRAIAIFGPDHRLTFYNHAYARLWNLPRSWLDTCPTQGAILDRLREGRRLPEQHDFATWKSSQLGLFGQPQQSSEEFWHLPDGKSLRVTSRAHPHGGLIVLFQDVSKRLRLERWCRMQMNVHKAMLEMVPDGAAIFGPDGRLKVYNTAFARIWRLCENDLRDEPHLRLVAEACNARFGHNSIWETVSSGINAAPFEQQGHAIEAERSDGRVISVSLTRLPDSSTLVSFVDLTDQRRLETALHEWVAA